MKVVQQTDANMLVGTTRVDSQGKDGEQLVTYRITYQNGQIVDQVALQTEKVSSAVARVVTTGTRVLFANDIVQMASDMAAANGWTGDEWTALYSLWNHESGFNPNAVNSSSGACGIPQAKPCGGLSSYTVEGQISWGLNYITNRYGDPVNAWNHEQKYGWY
jgi:hypothetical protein